MQTLSQLKVLQNLFKNLNYLNHFKSQSIQTISKFELFKPFYASQGSNILVTLTLFPKTKDFKNFICTLIQMLQHLRTKSQPWGWAKFDRKATKTLSSLIPDPECFTVIQMLQNFRTEYQPRGGQNLIESLSSLIQDPSDFLLMLVRGKGEGSILPWASLEYNEYLSFQLLWLLDVLTFCSRYEISEWTKILTQY